MTVECLSVSTCGHCRWHQSFHFDSVDYVLDKTRKLAISSDMLRRIATADFGDRKWLTIVRDVFMFSFYARRMSFVDMAYLKQSAVQDGILHYTRKKTGQVFSVRRNRNAAIKMDRFISLRQLSAMLPADHPAGKAPVSLGLRCA
jgi:hypothetical protein